MNHAKQEQTVQGHYRRYVTTSYVLLVLIWAAGGMLVWTGTLKPLSSEGGGKTITAVLAPFGILTWPAHEATLCLEGKGFGANALSPFSVSSVIPFALWCAILWAPLLLIRWRKTPLWLGAAAQILLLLLIFALFFKYGNA